jgi:hypothetical protein
MLGTDYLRGLLGQGPPTCTDYNQSWYNHVWCSSTKVVRLLRRDEKGRRINYLGTGALSMLGWALAARRMVGRKGAILDIISAI